MKNFISPFIFSLLLCLTSCNDSKVENNIKMYSNVWDEVINNGKLDLINATNFDKDITLISSPENIVGIENFKNYYSNFVTGFSDVKFTMKNVFGQDDNIVKHWSFKGTHSGDFFGIPASGKTVDVEGTTLVKMKDGKIAQEQDFMDNLVFYQQLGLMSSPENIGVIDSLYKSFATVDIPAVLASLDAEVIWNEAEGNALADGNPYIGPDAVLNGVFTRIGTDHDYFNLANIELHEMLNNQVLAKLRYQAKIKRTGKIIDVQAAHLWTLNNGKVTRFQQYVDTKKLNDALKK